MVYMWLLNAFVWFLGKFFILCCFVVAEIENSFLYEKFTTNRII